MRPLRLIIAALIGAIALVRPAAAHEIGVLNVDILAQPGGRIETIITSDADHLASVPGLGLSLANGVDRAALENLAVQLAKTLEPASQILGDGEPHPIGMLMDIAAILPGDQGDAAPPSPRIALHFSATIPHSTRTFSWRTNLGVGQYFLRIRRDEAGEPTAQWLKPGQASTPFPLIPESSPTAESDSPSSPASPETAVLPTVARYMQLGFTHILPEGLDHILFVLGLFLASTRLRPLLAQVTAFTAAHSISLALAASGLVRVSPGIVEPAIAASIVFVAAENLFSKRIGWRRTLVVFVFGLLHGLGFAGVLGELGLPRAQFVPALLSFNVGVELGQIAVILLAFAAVGLWRSREWYRPRVTIPASLLIACVGLFWTVQRVMTG